MTAIPRRTLCYLMRLDRGDPSPAARRSRSSSTVDGEPPRLAPSPRKGGMRSPAESARPAILARVTTIACSVRACRAFLVRGANCVDIYHPTVLRNCTALSLSVSALISWRLHGRSPIMTGLSRGWGSGLLGVVIFSGSLPATRVAVASFSPLFLTSARAVIAAALGALFLYLLPQSKPSRADLGRLAVVAVGVVIGFPLLTAMALQHITSAHSIVFIGLLPLATAIFGVLRGGERPKPMFWLFSCLGSLTVAGFALLNSTAGTSSGDLLMIAAIVLCGLGYAEGASLSRTLGGWQVISWALLLSLPVVAGVMWSLAK